jgi:hypothetical protein
MQNQESQIKIDRNQITEDKERHVNGSTSQQEDRNRVARFQANKNTPDKRRETRN